MAGKQRWRWFLATVGSGGGGGVGGCGVGREEAEAVGFEGFIVVAEMAEEEDDEGSENNDREDGDGDNQGNELDWFVGRVGGRWEDEGGDVCGEGGKHSGGGRRWWRRRRRGREKWEEWVLSGGVRWCECGERVFGFLRLVLRRGGGEGRLRNGGGWGEGLVKGKQGLVEKPAVAVAVAVVVGGGGEGEEEEGCENSEDESGSWEV